MNKPYLIVVAGPTASGKTKLSIQLAKYFNTEIVSADSRQFYRELNIGTAKPSVNELKETTHHLINSLALDEEYNIGKFEKDALHVLDEIFTRKHVAVLCGGSGLYIHAVCNGMDNLPQSDPKLRIELNNLFEKQGLFALQNKLLALDPEYYEIVDRQNPHRLIRAIEVCLLSGTKYSQLRSAKKSTRPFHVMKIGLQTDRDTLYKRIDSRVDEMIEVGLLEEARSVYPYRQLNSLQTVGYVELFDHFEGKTDLATAIQLIKQNTRNYAKRQLTWFKKDKDMNWFSPEHPKKIIQFIEDRMSENNG